ncbi:EAL domain-containing protein [Sulfurimonas sp.]|uniref:EAL domain-containing protein n=1 Tax=Sulfurimonas sp. TaxID=2022749 RepID=UPI00356580C8
MLLTIQRFTQITLMFVLLIVYLIFANYYLKQKEETSLVILNSLKNNMSELSYILSKNISQDSNVNSSRAILDRYTSNNDYIAAILVVEGDEIVVTTDPSYNSIPYVTDLISDSTLSAYEKIYSQKGIEGLVRFYDNGVQHTLRLIFMFDNEEIDMHFNQNKIYFSIYFGLLPIILLLVSWTIIKYIIARPLEKLRQYAYYQSAVPKSFKIKELEAIRASMVQTFSRLNKEQKELYRMARTDSLSGLANRHSLDEYLKRQIADSAHDKKEFAFLFLDIDHFKTVNDELGHTIGDELLKSVSSKIKEAIPENDFVARVGGDEFVVILHQYDTLSELTKIVENIQKSLSTQWVIKTHPVNITCSVGIAIYSKDGKDEVSLMQHASMAMYEAKKNGRACYHYFTEELNQKVKDTITLDKMMRQALKDKEYELYYQPKTDVKTGEILGVEALIRWISPSKGMIPPNVFIPLAEENGFITELGDWVLEEGIKQQAAWKEKGIDIIVSINVATKQLLDRSFEYKLTKLLKDTKVDPSKIDIEVTEYLFLEENDNNLYTLNMIRENGLTISLDDFGTGYSSLSYLKKFPIDNIKIDKVFMDDFNTKEGSIFVETIVKMGQTLNMNIIAEGIEQKEQVEYLKEIGCNCYQGYYCSKPLPVEEFEKFYKEYKPS